MPILAALGIPLSGIADQFQVLDRALHPHRRSNLLEIQPKCLQLPRQFRGLDSRHLLCTGHAHHQ